MERERSRNVHRVSLRHAAAAGATAGMAKMKVRVGGSVFVV